MKGRTITLMTIVLGLCLVLGSISAGAWIKGTGVIDMGSAFVDRNNGVERYNSMEGDGYLEIGPGGFGRGSGVGRVHSAQVNGSDAKIHVGGTRISYSGKTPLVGFNSIESKSMYGGTGTTVQESFSVNEMEREQASYVGGRSQVIGFDNKVSFNGTWMTMTTSHKPFEKDIMSRQVYSGTFEIEKQTTFGGIAEKIPSLSLVVLPNQSAVQVDDAIVRDYVVTNDGDTPLLDVVLIDSRVGQIDLDKSRLNPGDVALGRVDYIIKEQDIHRPQNDLVRATGSDLQGNVAVATANTSMILVRAPESNLAANISANISSGGSLLG